MNHECLYHDLDISRSYNIFVYLLCIYIIISKNFAYKSKNNNYTYQEM